MDEAGGKCQNASDVLAKMARKAPYYERNRPHICSFWVKGECRRGEECPYRHERPTDPEDPLSNQNFKDRYHLLSAIVIRLTLLTIHYICSTCVVDNSEFKYL